MAAAMALTASAEVANVKTTVSVLEGGREQNDAPRKVYSMESIILSENFDTLEEGTTEEPDYGAPLAIGTTDIDPVLTHGKQWRGDLVYPAGGAIALQSDSALGMASLNTPLGDYSGSIKVSFLVKFLLCEWNDNGTMMHYPISNINVGLYNERENRFNVDSGEENFYGANLAAINIDDNGEWYRVVIEFDNYSAYNDAFLVFFTNTAVVLDDIEITRSSHKFIAAPVIAGLSDLTETSFTVNFEKVEAAFDYIAHLYVVDSYDSETGEPIYSPILDAGTMAFLEEYGMTVEEYMEMLGPDA